MKDSAIIIGGGLGGLFTGAILSKEGVKVTVIEKNTTLGGGLQSFTRFGEIFDTGMHVIGGMQVGGNIRRLCEYLGIFDKIQIRNVNPRMIDRLYFAEDKKVYRIAQGKENFISALAESFPNQRKNIAAYTDAIYKIVAGLDMFFLRPASGYLTIHSDDFLMAADSFIAKYISDDRLRSVLAYMNPLYGGRPGMTPAYIHALISVLYINGPSHFAGGSYLFANALRDSIVENGGEIIVGDGVEHVSSADKLITGVVTQKGRRFSANHYICAIYPCTFISLLDDPSILPKSYRTRLDSIPVSYSAFTLNLKLKPDTFKFMNYTGYYMSTYGDIWNFGREDKEWPLGFLYMTPPEICQREFSTKMIITAPMTWSHVKPWENSRYGHRNEEYEEWKTACAEKLLDRMEELYPHFRSYVEAINAASPLTIRDFYGIKEGAMCGYSKDCNNMALSQVPVVTKVKNLLLTGQNCNIHGFCGVPLTAINTCEAILGHNYVIESIHRYENSR